MGAGDRIVRESRDRTALAAALREVREYTRYLYAHLTPAQRAFPLLAIVNPPDWELGHVGWFQEFWCRRWREDDIAAARTPSRLADADALFDSRHVPHDTRWELPLPSWEGIHDYLAVTLADTLEAIPRMTEAELDRVELALLHEDMHGEALLMTLHTLGLPAPAGLAVASQQAIVADGDDGDDVAVDGGTFTMGTPDHVPSRRHVFDNELRAHPVTLPPFAIARHPASAGAFAAFVDEGGYREPRHWTPAGRDWLAQAGRQHPAHWRRTARTGGWEERRFDGWAPLAEAAPMRHVTLHEAQAWCRWAGRRLPLEAEWEKAARDGAIPVRGAVWEWTATPFGPYPGFVPGIYAEYSAPWFGDHTVLRGGSWATRARIAAPAFRNFYRPDRHDPFVGFRSCASAPD